MYKIAIAFLISFSAHAFDGCCPTEAGACCQNHCSHLCKDDSPVNTNDIIAKVKAIKSEEPKYSFEGKAL